MISRNNNHSGPGNKERNDNQQKGKSTRENQESNALTEEELRDRNIASSIEEGGTDGPRDVDEGDMENYNKDTDRGV